MFGFLKRQFDRLIEWLYFKQKNNLALNDQMTGAHNYNWLVHIGNEKYLGKEIFVTVIDVNNFKALNDTYGHMAGNELLKSITNQLKGLKEIDAHSHVVRYGGDEFVIFSRCDLTTFLEKDNYAKHIVSYGVSKKEKDEPIIAAFNRADDLMYEYKKRVKEQQKLEGVGYIPFPIK